LHGDRLFWVALKQVWERWRDHRTIVKPETIIHWHRNRFKKHWNKLLNKNKKPGRKRIKREIRDLIYRMAVENNWGAPRIYSELLMLGKKGNIIWVEIKPVIIDWEDSVATLCFINDITERNQAIPPRK